MWAVITSKHSCERELSGRYTVRPFAVSTLFTRQLRLDVKHTFSTGMPPRRRVVVKSFHFENKSITTSKNYVPWLRNIHRHTCVYPESVCVCEEKTGRDTDFPFGNWTFRFPPLLSLYSRSGLFIFPSYPKQGSAPRSSDLACHPDVCTQRPPWTLLLSCFSLPSSLSLNPLQRLCLSSPFVPFFGGNEEVWLNVLCSPWHHQLLFSVTASEVLLLKPAAAREDASDGFCPLFHSLPFIPMCSSRHQGRFLTSMLFRQWCHGHGDVVLCLRLSSTAKEKTQDSDVDECAINI